jgi:ferredoxin-thioredoxin reductase catalytic subunit
MEFKLTDNKELLDNLRKGFKKKGGYCPCKLEKSDDNICPCVEFIETGKCHCGLFEKVNK